MTDSQKLDLLLEKMISFDGRMCSLEGKVDSLEGKVNSLEGKVNSLEGRMDSLEGELVKFKNQVTKSIDELKEMDIMILDEVERVHRILDKHKADPTAHIA